MSRWQLRGNTPVKGKYAIEPTNSVRRTVWVDAKAFDDAWDKKKSRRKSKDGQLLEIAANPDKDAVLNSGFELVD